MSDEYEERLVRARYRKGLHLDASQDTPGALRATARDGSNRLAGQAELFPVDADHDRELDDRPDDDDRDEEEEADLGALLGLVGLAAASYGAVKVVSHIRQSRRRKKEATRPIDSSPAEEVTVRTSERVLPPADWYEDCSGRARWWDGQRWTDLFKGSENSAAAVPSETAGHQDEAESAQLSREFQQPQTTMSSAEWKDRVRAMLLARAFSEEQWRLLSNARIQDADAAVLERQSELRELTPQQISDRMSAILANNPHLLQETPALAQAGWYDDGLGNSRWWDGRLWTNHVERVMVEAAVPPSNQPSASPGWYDDGSGRQRWWNGRHWA
jgi:hypothetical protein